MCFTCIYRDQMTPDMTGILYLINRIINITDSIDNTNTTEDINNIVKYYSTINNKLYTDLEKILSEYLANNNITEITESNAFYGVREFNSAGYANQITPEESKNIKISIQNKVDTIIEMNNNNLLELKKIYTEYKKFITDIKNNEHIAHTFVDIITDENIINNELSDELSDELSNECSDTESVDSDHLIEEHIYKYILCERANMQLITAFDIILCVIKTIYSHIQGINDYLTAEI
jgi:hypothetical protein